MALRRLGCQHALVVHGEDGLDEVSIAAPSQIWELKDDDIHSFAVAPEDLGLTRGLAGSHPAGARRRRTRLLWSGRYRAREALTGTSCS